MPLAWAASDITIWALHSHDLYRGTIPAKLYEAMASGTPIVAATEGAAARLIRESNGGIAVDCGDVDGMVSAIRQLLTDDDLRSQFSQAGRAYAEQHFNADAVATRYEAILRQSTREIPRR
jgi:glycosyltransferase involved in cell wall biosynthesis